MVNPPDYRPARDGYLLRCQAIFRIFKLTGLSKCAPTFLIMQSLLTKLYEAKWALLGIVLVAFIAWISLSFVSPIVFALFLYYISRPIKRRLHPYIKNETLLALTCLLLVALPLVAIIAYLIIFAANQLISLLSQPGIPVLPPGQLANISQALSADSGPFSPTEMKYEDLGSRLSEWYDHLKVYADSIFGLKDLLVATGASLAGAAFNALLILILAFFLLLGDDHLVKWFTATFPRLAREKDDLFIRYARAVDEDFEHIFFGNVLNIVFFAINAAIIYWLLGIFAPDPAFVIPAPVLLGILSGIAALLPVVGGWMIDIPILLYVLAQSLISGSFATYWWYWLLMAAALFIFVENLPNYLLRPFMSHGKVDVGLLMLAYILGPVIFGFPGLFIGAMLLVLITHYFRIVVPGIQHGEKEKGGRHRRRPHRTGPGRR